MVENLKNLSDEGITEEEEEVNQSEEHSKLGGNILLWLHYISSCAFHKNNIK